jgi:hypothetical protein
VQHRAARADRVELIGRRAAERDERVDPGGQRLERRRRAGDAIEVVALGEREQRGRIEADQREDLLLRIERRCGRDR